VRYPRQRGSGQRGCDTRDKEGAAREKEREGLKIEDEAIKRPRLAIWKAADTDQKVFVIGQVNLSSSTRGRVSALLKPVIVPNHIFKEMSFVASSKADLLVWFLTPYLGFYDRRRLQLTCKYTYFALKKVGLSIYTSFKKRTSAKNSSRVIPETYCTNNRGIKVWPW
jgi:hypothetical protein